MQRSVTSTTGTILVTGGSRGIGASCLAQLQQAGFAVVAVSRTPPTHPGVTFIPCDLSDKQAVAALGKHLWQLPPFAGIVLAAGYGRFGYLEQLAPAAIDRLMQVNFLAQAHLVKSLLPAMKRAGAGRIVWIGSEAGLKGARQGTAYCASKFAVRGFCQALRDEVRREGIHVSHVAPGLTRTEFYADLDFAPAAGDLYASQAAGVAHAVVQCLQAPRDCVWEEVVLQPPLPRVAKANLAATASHPPPNRTP